MKESRTRFGASSFLKLVLEVTAAWKPSGPSLSCRQAAYETQEKDHGQQGQTHAYRSNYGIGRRIARDRGIAVVSLVHTGRHLSMLVYDPRTMRAGSELSRLLRN
jgi:hypothetical protein